MINHIMTYFHYFIIITEIHRLFKRIYFTYMHVFIYIWQLGRSKISVMTYVTT